MTKKTIERSSSTPQTTPSYSASALTLYLSAIGRHSLLTAEEERGLATKIQKTGDEEARMQMMLANLRLVVSIAKQYVTGNDPELLMDLIQEGNIGLMRGIDRFDPKFKTRFSTYGVYWIRQAVLRALKNRRLVRLPENVFDKILAMQRTRQRLYQILGRAPTPEELAREMDSSAKEIYRLEQVNADVISLEKSVRGKDDEENTRLGDLIEDSEALSPDEATHTSLMQQKVRSAVDTLPSRERAIIEARFGLSDNAPKTLEEIGQQFQISRERVRQLQNVALERLHKRKLVHSIN